MSKPARARSTTSTPAASTPTGLSIARRLSTGVPRDHHFEWSRRHVEIKEGDTVVFSGDVEAPTDWSDLAVTVSAKTWFRTYTHPGETAPRREDSILQMISRVVDAVVDASRYPDVGTDYFGGDEERRRIFGDELFCIFAGQYAMLNTPAWVNVGVATPKHVENAETVNYYKKLKKKPRPYGVYGNHVPANSGPQASACFIQAVEDTMESLCALQTSETQLFRRGSGTGSNLSTLRPAGSPLANGGTASGPVSFMRGLDGWAGVTKSGGSSRRAALMRVLDVYHPDVDAFIQTKVTAQKMIRDLAAAGWDGGFNATATTWIPYQNANNSVRVDDAFMKAATTGGKITPHWPTEWNGAFVDKAGARPPVDASALLDRIAAAAHDCGDPGVQYDTKINEWHTVPNAGRICASNPCSEYMHLQDSACNLASLRLRKFLNESSSFDVDLFHHVARVVFIAQEILVGAASYPTPAIAKNSHDFRPLGLGYADLGATLMSLGLPYDSADGRTFCADVTSLLGAVAYRTSAEIARDCGGPFPGFAANREPMLGVIRQHVEYAKQLNNDGAASWVDKATYNADRVADAASLIWDAALDIGTHCGYRNAQATVLAPTGTIGFAMDCDTTGIEPDTALVKRKKLAGGGVIEYVNQAVPSALRRLGYLDTTVSDVVETIRQTGAIPNDVSPYHLPIFATAFGQPGNEVSVDGHLKMMAAAQPFLSGAISKTVNCPSSYTVADVREVFVKAWKLGLKAVAVYRDGSKDQPLEAKTTTAKTEMASLSPGKIETIFKELLSEFTPSAPPSKPLRRRLPVDAVAHRHKFSLGGVDGYIHLGLYPDDNTVGEIFIRMEPKAKSQIAVDLATQAASVAIQHGADIAGFLDKWEGTEFAPQGFTGEGENGVAWASSPLDYLSRWLRRWLANRAATATAQRDGLYDVEARAAAPTSAPTPKTPHTQAQGPSCGRCGSVMRRDGACLSCPTCGYGQGGCGG